MKFVKDLYEGLIQRPLMTVEKIARKFASAHAKRESW